MRTSIDIEAAMLVDSMGKLPGTDLKILPSEKARDAMETFVRWSLYNCLLHADRDFMLGREIKQITNDYVIRFCMSKFGSADKWMLLADKALRTNGVVDFNGCADMLKASPSYDYVAISFKEFVAGNCIDPAKVGSFFSVFMKEIHHFVIGACAEAYMSRFNQRSKGCHKPFKPISWTYDKETDTFEYTCFSFGKERVLNP